MLLSQYLAKRSKEICLDNECTEDKHNCESYAYILVDFDTKNSDGITNDTIEQMVSLRLVDICSSDFFQGVSGDQQDFLSAVPLPFNGTEKELKQFCMNDISYWETKE
jgi:hypothetical protein